MYYNIATGVVQFFQLLKLDVPVNFSSVSLSMCICVYLYVSVCLCMGVYVYACLSVFMSVCSLAYMPTRPHSQCDQIWQHFQAFGNNYFAQTAHILVQFCKVEAIDF